MGWLNSSPKSEIKGELQATRLEKKISEGIEIEYPPCSMMSMVEYLFSAGPTCVTPNGSVPLSHQEIWAWQKNMGIKLNPWEVQALRNMSRQYLYELLQSDKQDSPPPWVPKIDQKTGKQVAKRVKDILRG